MWLIRRLRGPWLSLVLLCSVGAALAQLPPRGMTPVPTIPRQTPIPTVPVPQPTIPVVTSPTPIPTGIYTRWRVTIEWQDPTTGQWTVDSVHLHEGAGPIEVKATLQRRAK